MIDSASRAPASMARMATGGGAAHTCSRMLMRVSPHDDRFPCLERSCEPAVDVQMCLHQLSWHQAEPLAQGHIRVMIAAEELQHSDCVVARVHDVMSHR